MERKYLVLATVIQNEFSYTLELNRDESIEFLLNGIKEGYYDVDVLRQEYEQAMEDKSFDWLNFAIKNRMFWDDSSYSNSDIQNYLRFYLHDVLYPNQELSSEKFDVILKTAQDILKNKTEKNEWLELKMLHQLLVKKYGMKNLPYSIMYKLMLNRKFSIEGKTERGKGRECIYVKNK